MMFHPISLRLPEELAVAVDRLREQVERVAGVPVTRTAILLHLLHAGVEVMDRRMVRGRHPLHGRRAPPVPAASNTDTEKPPCTP